MLAQLWRTDASTQKGLYVLSRCRSDAIEPILQKLNVGWMKRRALRNYETVTEIEVLNDACLQGEDTMQGFGAFNHEPSEIFMKTQFPFNTVKAGAIPIGGMPFTHFVSWCAGAPIHPKRRLSFAICRTTTQDLGSPRLI